MMDKKTIISAFRVAVAAACAISALSYGEEDPASIQHRYMTPSMRVSTNAWLSVSRNVERIVSAATNGLAKASDLDGYLPLTGGTLTGDLAVGEEHTASLKLTVSSESDANGITLQGGKSNGNGSSVLVGGSTGSGGSIRIEGGGTIGGRLYVDCITGVSGGAIEVSGTDASIKKDGKEVATEEQLNAKADKTSVYTTSEVDAKVAAVGSKADEAYSAAEQMVSAVNSLSGTVGSHIRDTDNPHKVTAAQVGALPIIGGTLTGDLAVGEAFAGSRTLSIASDNGAAGITLQGGTSYGNGSILTIGGSHGGGATLNVNGGAMRGGHVIVGASTGGGGILEVQGSDASIKKDGKEVATESYVDAKVENAVLPTNPTFSNAVLAVGLNIDTDSVAVLNEIASTFGGFPIEGTATTVGGLLAALAAAVAWLKKNKADKDALDALAAKVEYPFYAVPSTGVLKDRAINTANLATVTVPDNFTDLLVRASVASSLSVTMPESITTKYGDTFPGEAGEYLITITKTGASEAYVRTIKLEEVA